MDTVNHEMPYTTDSTGTVRKTQGQTMEIIRTWYRYRGYLLSRYFSSLHVEDEHSPFQNDQHGTFHKSITSISASH